MPASSSSPVKVTPGDGFTPEELQVSPPTSTWVPTLDYEESDIASLEPGPRHLALMGRVVNFYDMPKPSKRPKAAQGLVKIMVADDTGTMFVRLWYAKTTYPLQLGQLVTLWTIHISQGDGQVGLAPSAAPLFTSIFPENERNCHFMIHDRSDDRSMFKRPFGARDSQVLPGLMTLKSFVDGGFDIDDCKLMVCVRSIGPRKKYTNKNGSISDLITAVVFDDSSEGHLTLYGSVSGSASAWKPYATVLLITAPGWRIDKTAKLSLNANTRVFIDPSIAEARYLRALAQRLTKKEHVNPPFPYDLFDTKEAELSTVKVLYKLSEIDEFARTNPREKAVGYMSIIVTELHILTNYKREMLMSNECCGKPIFASKVKARCRQCDRECTLRINPRILGDVIDETGTISTGKLIFSDTAWEQLLGRTAEQLVTASLDVIKYLEQRLLFLRLTLGFGIYLGSEEIGRLVVWCVKI
ncbi:uncharacterized protein CC84DRAFT_1261574 [Paraphaeosphaeria sporulosa]|uniref:Nucleic acid-binding protein n=1 Tax=Paraphaeosphaeria sporulosa TaxID=1460663 RepID=A0A177C661_9PLEO|nr:uncharacterized protein CC84DRAFT_1261574 [Paraphaeosphaeria sporulosa]OAG02896.1 hypothetical protein CC84DRAFT_1261574 [Paraphaeosphaeria sporulosa]